MYKLEIKVHTGLDRAKPCIRLWYLAKASSDTGIAKLSLTESAETLGSSTRTIQHYLTEGKRWGYFRDWKRDGDDITIYYSNLVDICVKHNFQLGYSAFISTELLPDLKQITAEILAQGLQSASRRAAAREQYRIRKNGRKGKSKSQDIKDINLPRPEDYFLPPSELSAGVLGNYGDILLLSQSITPYGASINGIAARMGRHPQTIKNRLKDSEKVRLAHHNYLNASEMRILEEDWDENAGKYFSYKGRIFKLHTNMYMPRYDLKSCSQLKQKITRKSGLDGDYSSEVGNEVKTNNIPSKGMVSGISIISSSKGWGETGSDFDIDLVSALDKFYG